MCKYDGIVSECHTPPAGLNVQTQSYHWIYLLKDIFDIFKGYILSVTFILIMFFALYTVQYCGAAKT